MHVKFPMNQRQNPYDIMSNMQDCDILVSEFKLQLCYYIHFLILLGKVWLILLNYGLCYYIHFLILLGKVWLILLNYGFNSISKKPNQWTIFEIWEN